MSPHPPQHRPFLCREQAHAAQSGGGVRSHFRRLPDGRLTWVRAHQPALMHELYVQSVRKVE